MFDVLQHGSNFEVYFFGVYDAVALLFLNEQNWAMSRKSNTHAGN